MSVVRQAIAMLNRAAEEAGHDTPDGQALVEAAHGLKLAMVAQERKQAMIQGEKPRATPDLGRISSRLRTASLSTDDKQAIVAEVGAASNSHKLDLAGTHYVQDNEFDLEWWLGI